MRLSLLLALFMLEQLEDRMERNTRGINQRVQSKELRGIKAPSINIAADMNVGNKKLTFYSDGSIKSIALTYGFLPLLPKQFYLDKKGIIAMRINPFAGFEFNLNGNNKPFHPANFSGFFNYLYPTQINSASVYVKTAYGLFQETLTVYPYPYNGVFKPRDIKIERTLKYKENNFLLKDYQNFKAGLGKETFVDNGTLTFPYYLFRASQNNVNILISPFCNFMGSISYSDINSNRDINTKKYIDSKLFNFKPFSLYTQA